MLRIAYLTVAALICVTCCAPALAATVTFFDPSQVATLVAEGTTWDRIRSNGYYFTYTRDKLFTGGIGPDPIGRSVRVPWPQGVEAQAVTTPPPGVTDYKARITLSRVDGDMFDLTAFTAKLLANTAGAGGSIEIMPMLNGEEGFNDPLYFNATGYYGQTFSYDESPSYLGSTALLKGFDTYKIGLYVDFALLGLSLEGAAIPPSPGDYNENGVVDAADYVVWRDSLGQTGSGLAADGNSNNQIDGGDYTVWKVHFGQAAGSGSGASANAAVPEQSTLVLLILATAVMRPRRRPTE